MCWGSGSKNAGILFQFPHLFPYFNSCRRFCVTIMAVMQIYENLVPTHIMQILMVAETLLQPSDGYRKPSATVKIWKQMRKPKQNTSVFLHTWGCTPLVDTTILTTLSTHPIHDPVHIPLLIPAYPHTCHLSTPTLSRCMLGYTQND